MSPRALPGHTGSMHIPGIAASGWLAETPMHLYTPELMPFSALHAEKWIPPPKVGMAAAR